MEQLLERHGGLLQRLVKARLGADLRRRVASSDLLQSTYIDILASIGGFPGRSEEDFARSIVRILENNIRDAAKYYGAAEERRWDLPPASREPVCHSTSFRAV